MFYIAKHHLSEIDKSHKIWEKDVSLYSSRITS